MKRTSIADLQIKLILSHQKPFVETQWLVEYIESLQEHIGCVREIGHLLNVPIPQLAQHDQSKYGLLELPYYARQFYGDKGDPAGFAGAWLHHQNHNPHHWEYWVSRSVHSADSGADPATGALPMPDIFLREMVADWMGASKAYTGHWSIRAWWAKKEGTIVLHPDTRVALLELLEEVHYGDGA